MFVPSRVAIPPITPMFAALFAMFVWGAVAVVVIQLHPLPPLEILSYSLSLSFLATCLYVTWHKKWQVVTAPPMMWFVGSVAIGGNSLLYISAMQLAPPVHVELIMYMWPLMVFIGNVVFFGQAISAKRIGAILLCLTGLMLLHGDSSQWTLGREYTLGYVCVGCSAIIWAGYNLYTKYQSQVSVVMIGMYAGVGAMIVIPLHCLLDTHVPVDATLILPLLTLGVLSQWLSFQAWDMAIKGAEAIKMTIIAYMKPIISVLLLITCGYGYFSWSVLLALLCVIIAGVLVFDQDAACGNKRITQ